MPIDSQVKSGVGKKVARNSSKLSLEKRKKIAVFKHLSVLWPITFLLKKIAEVRELKTQQSFKECKFAFLDNINDSPLSSSKSMVSDSHLLVAATAFPVDVEISFFV